VFYRHLYAVITCSMYMVCGCQAILLNGDVMMYDIT